MTDQQNQNSTDNVSGGVNLNTQGDASIQGDVVGRDKIVNISVQAAYAEGTILCPVDKHIDMVQKVSAIVSSTSGNSLTQKLSLPPEPTMPSYLFEALVYVAVSCVAFAIFFAFVVRTDVCGWIFGIGTAILYFIGARAFNKSQNKQRKQDQIDFDKNRQQWPEIKAIWEKTYYCHKHDVAFIAGQTQTATPDKFYSFLSDNISM
jgi:hypothetical protein